MIHDEFHFNTKRFANSPFCRFKGSSGPDPPNPNIADTEFSKWARGVSYPAIGSAIAGEGLDPDLLAKRKTSAFKSLEKSYGTAAGELESNLSRTVAPGDTRVKGALRNTLSRSYVTGKDYIRRGFDQELVDDKTLGITMANDALAQEKRMAVGLSSQYNQALASNQVNEAQFGTFSTNLAGGLGEFAGSYIADQYFSSKMAGTG